MGDEKISSRSLRRQKQKMWSFGAFIGCVIVAANTYAVLKPYFAPLPIHFHVERRNPTISKFSNSRTDVYEINGDVRIHGISSTIFIASTDDHNTTSWSTKPYPRKDNYGAMRKVTNFTIITKAAGTIPHCTRNLSVPAILFSTGGHAGNHFHAFADVLVPLFLTSHHFNGATIFLATNHNSEWTSHYSVIIEKLSKYDVYDIDSKREVLCFPRMIVGLKAHNDLEIVPSQSEIFSRRNFTELLNLERFQTAAGRMIQPRMLIISRESSRKLRNEGEVSHMARSLGFEVVLKTLSWNVSLTAQLVNSFDVLVGVHGAGLTNLLFLPENSVLIQIVPFGLDYVATICYEGAMDSNKLKYIRYNVSLSESSLLGKYPPDSDVYRKPWAVSKNFDYYRTVYLDNQDVILDLNRFRKTLLRALEFIRT